MRTYSGLAGAVVRALLCATALLPFIYILNLFEVVDMYIFPVSYRALFGGLVLTAVFLLLPATKESPRNKLPWYDILWILISLGPCIYLLLFYGQALRHGVYAYPHEVVLGILFILAVLEATRRTSSWIAMLVMVVFGIYPLVCNFFPVGSLLYGPEFSFARIIGHYYLFEDGVFGIIMDVITAIVVFYICFAQMLNRTGAGDKFTQLAFAVTGRYRGGPAKAAVMASGTFGMFVGSVPANIATTGTITIPLMKKVGYTPEFAAAVETVASTGGSVTPPVMGAVAFLIAEFLGLPYGTIVLSAAAPALLYYLGCMMQVDGRAVKLGLRGLSRQELPSARAALKGSWVFIIPLIILIIFLVVLHYRASTACLYALLTLLVLSMLRKESRVGPRRAEQILSDTTKRMMSLIPIVLAAGLIVSAVGLTGIGIRMSQLLILVSGNSLVTLVLISAAAVIIMSMGLPSTPCYIIPAILIAPAIVTMGVPPLAAHFFIFYVSRIAFLTPPVCIGAYVASAIAESKPMTTGFMAMRLGIVAYIVPFLFITTPAILMIGSIPEIVICLTITIIGIIALSVGIEGTLSKRTCNLVQRILFIGGGIALILPNTLVALIGASVLIVVTLWMFKPQRIKQPTRY